eukprot:CAMPEP_0115062222 /NCGR_PEP_ID=MMETSP0227-20121206/8422_1 /TAXON_ID=89957 /ORGANISM="Polarella glacialis, Strain CCMP 1383" /LENGTH=629 /DNA_ID=CAMNT_0002447569 /DNA_START=47 /DNA_END=1936 /DNA_ORIENTATION=-
MHLQGMAALSAGAGVPGSPSTASTPRNLQPSRQALNCIGSNSIGTDSWLGLRRSSGASEATEVEMRWAAAAAAIGCLAGAAHSTRRGLRLRRVAAIGATATQEAPASSKEQPFVYSWERQWYPVMPVTMLEGNGPEPLKLLGKDLVLFRDLSSTWRCTGGICPHRLAPLAKGRVNEQGQLMCRFHGWCFEGKSGKCAKVPMAEGDAEAEKRLLGTAASQLASYPTKIVKGLLFVWPHVGSEEEASSTEPVVMEELGESPNWGVIDAPASWRVWMEQSWDPSHAPFLHQFSLGNFAPENAVAMTPFKVEDLGDAGLRAEHGGYMKTNMDLQANRRFAPPCANFTTYVYPDGRTTGFSFYFVPTEANTVRQITTSYFVPAPAGAKDDKSQGGLKGQLQMSQVIMKGRTIEKVKGPKKSLVASAMDAACKRWPGLGPIRRGFKVLDILNARLGDQDNAVLSFQDSVGLPSVQSGALRSPAPSQRYGGPASEYLLETHADALVSRFDTWVAARGGGPFGSESAEKMKSAADEMKSGNGVFDRWAAHTSFAKDAQAALSFTAGAADLLESSVMPAAWGATALCLVLGLTRTAALPALVAAGAAYATARLRKVAHSFVSGLPPAPGLPVKKLWDQ